MSIFIIFFKIKKLIIIFIFFICFSKIKSQELLIQSHYLNNEFLLNPAFTGIKNFTIAKASDHKQWSNVKNAPSTQIFILESQFLKKKNKKHGGSFYLFNDKNGSNKQFITNFSYAIHFAIDRYNYKKTELSFGFSLSNYIFSLDSRNLKTTEENDPAIKNAIESAYFNNFSFGVSLYGENYYTGVSGTHLLKNSINLYDENLEPKFARHYFFYFGYKIQEVKNQLIIEPVLVIKLNKDKKLQQDYNVKLAYKNLFGAISYRVNYDKFNASNIKTIFLLGMNFQNFTGNYVFEIPLNELYMHYSISHKITIGYKIFPKKR